MTSACSRVAATISILLAACVCACGGGGGSDSGPAVPPPAVLELLAGSPGGVGAADGTGANAAFTIPTGLSLDRAGNVYLVDSPSFTLRRVTPQGSVSTLAGTTGQAGFIDGVGKAARFNNPVATTIDAVGNLYVVDQLNHAIRRVTPDGIVTTIAGDGRPSYVDGTGRAATFSGPVGIAIDAAGNLFVADTGNCAIRKIDAAANVTTYAGGGPNCSHADGFRTHARFGRITGVAIDSLGNLIVAEDTAISKITPDGNVQTVAGDPDHFGYVDAQGTSARFLNIMAIATDSHGNVYAGESANAVLRKVAPDGNVTTVAGKRNVNVTHDGDLASTTFLNFQSIAVAPNGELVIAEYTVVRVLNFATGSRTLAGRLPAAGYVDGERTNARFDDLTDIVADASGNLYVSDSRNHAVRKIAPSGTVTTLAAGFDVITAMTIDAAANLYVVNYQLCGPPRFDCKYTLFRVDGAGAKTLLCELPLLPMGIARDNAGNFYLSSGGSLIVRMTPACATDDISVPALISRGVALDGAGNLYFADERGHTVLKMAPSGLVEILAGAQGEPGSRDGAGRDARFSMPRDVAVDGAGNVYIADRGNSLVRKITPTRVVSTVAGTVGQDGFVAGPLPGVVQPVAIAVTGNDLYIAMPSAVAVVRNRP